MSNRTWKLSVSAVLSIAVLAGPTVAAEAPELDLDAFIEPALDTTQTKCGVTVCATSVAISSVVCSRPAPLTVQCTGAGTVGGQGTSIVGLAGRVDWHGSATCSGECGSPGSGGRSGSATWAGFPSASGSGSQSTISLGTKVKVSVFRDCLSQGVTTRADALARTTIAGVTLESVSAPTATHIASTTACNY